MNIIIEQIKKYAGIKIINESAPDLVGRKVSELINNGKDIDTLLNRIADEAVNNPEKFPVGNGKFLNIKIANNREIYINNIINNLNIKDTTKRKTIEKKIRQLEEKFKNAIIGGKNDKKVAPIIKHKTEYKAPVYHGWGY